MNEFRLILQDATNYGFWNFIAYLMLMYLPVQLIAIIIGAVFKVIKRRINE